MLGIILNILKVIGIILLILLALIIFLAGIILFVPIRYRAEGAYQTTYSVEAGISWLLHIVSVHVKQSSSIPLHIVLKVFGITIYDNTRPAKAGRKKAKKSSRKNTTETAQVHAASYSYEEKESASHKNPDTSLQNDADVEEADADLSDSEPKLTFWQKINIFFRKIIHFFKNIKYTFRKFYDTIVNIKNNVHYYCDLLTQDTTKAAFGAASKQLVRIMHNLRPRKWHVHLHIGMEDPASMGDILGIWGMLYPLHEGHVELEPEFDRSIIEGDFFFKGRIHLFVYLWTAYIILFDKNIKQLKKSLLRKDSKTKNP